MAGQGVFLACLYVADRCKAGQSLPQAWVSKNDSIKVYTDQSSLSVGSGGSVNSLRRLFDFPKHGSLFSTY